MLYNCLILLYYYYHYYIYIDGCETPPKYLLLLLHRSLVIFCLSLLIKRRVRKREISCNIKANSIYTHIEWTYAQRHWNVLHGAVVCKCTIATNEFDWFWCKKSIWYVAMTFVHHNSVQSISKPLCIRVLVLLQI